MVEVLGPEGHPEGVARDRRLATANASWSDWFREEFLRSCFVGAALAWDGMGAVEIRYLLDPWYPGQGAAPGWVYGVIVAFLVGSLIGQAVLYRLWWPSEGSTRGHKPPRNLDEHYAVAQQKRYF